MPNNKMFRAKICLVYTLATVIPLFARGRERACEGDLNGAAASDGSFETGVLAVYSQIIDKFLEFATPDVRRVLVEKMWTVSLIARPTFEDFTRLIGTTGDVYMSQLQATLDLFLSQAQRTPSNQDLVIEGLRQFWRGIVLETQAFDHQRVRVAETQSIQRCYKDIEFSTPQAVRISDNGQYAMVQMGQENFEFWNLATREVDFRLSENAVVQFLQDQNRISIRTDSWKIWDLEQSLQAAAFTPIYREIQPTTNPQIYIGVHPRELHIYDFSVSQEPIRHLEIWHPQTFIDTVKLSDDQKSLVAVLLTESKGIYERSIHVWQFTDTLTSRFHEINFVPDAKFPTSLFSRVTGTISSSIEFAGADERYLLTADTDSIGVRQRDGTLITVLAKGENLAMTAARLTPDRETLLVTHKNAAVLWDLRSLAIKTVLADSESLTNVLFSRSGRLIFARMADPRMVGTWDAATGRSLGEFSLHLASVNGPFALTPDGRSLVVPFDLHANATGIRVFDLGELVNSGFLSPALLEDF